MNVSIGDKYGELTVIGFSHINKHRQKIWDCFCECGNNCKVATSSLTSGHSKSCGCNRRKNIVIAVTKHKQSKNRLYRIWCNMKTRCYNKNSSVYKNYGGRGIQVCSDWKDYKVFSEWASKNGYNEKLTLDRIDNNKGYSPDNCRWISFEEQQCNKRNNVYLCYQGKTLSMVEWSKLLGIKYDTLQYRYHKGFTVEKILSTKKYVKGV